jgi:hypothetical protein
MSGIESFMLGVETINVNGDVCEMRRGVDHGVLC